MTFSLCMSYRDKFSHNREGSSLSRNITFMYEFVGGITRAYSLVWGLSPHVIAGRRCNDHFSVPSMFPTPRSEWQTWTNSRQPSRLKNQILSDNMKQDASRGKTFLDMRTVWLNINLHLRRTTQSTDWRILSNTIMHMYECLFTLDASHDIMWISTEGQSGTLCLLKENRCMRRLQIYNWHLKLTVTDAALANNVK